MSNLFLSLRLNPHPPGKTLDEEGHTQSRDLSCCTHSFQSIHTNINILLCMSVYFLRSVYMIYTISVPSHWCPQLRRTADISHFSVSLRLTTPNSYFDLWILTSIWTCFPRSWYTETKPGFKIFSWIQTFRSRWDVKLVKLP